MKTKISLPLPLSSGKHFLILDIGTEAVKVLAFKKNKEQIAVLGSSLEYFDSSNIFGEKGNLVTDDLQKTIAKALDSLWRTQKIKTNLIFLNLPGNILREKIHSQKLVRGNKTKTKRVSKTEEKTIYQQALNTAAKEISEEAAKHSGILPGDFEFLSFRIVKIKIEGYDVPYLEGFSGNDLYFDVLTAFLPRYYLLQFKKIIKQLNLKIVKIIPPAEGLLNFFKKTDGVFLDIGGNITKISIIKDGKLELAGSVGLGGEDFSSVLRHTLGLSAEAARAMKEQYSSGKLSEGVKNKIKAVFYPYIKDWFSALQAQIKNKTSLLPHDFFIFGGGALLPDFREVIEKQEWGDTTFGNEPRVKIIYPKDCRIAGKTIFNIQLSTPQETPALLSAYCAQQNA